MLGYAAIPDEWKSGIPALADRKFAFTNYSFNEIVASTLERAATVVEQAGGRVTADALQIPVQAPKPPALEQWNSGVPVRLVPVSRPGVDVARDLDAGLGERRQDPHAPRRGCPDRDLHVRRRGRRADGPSRAGRRARRRHARRQAGGDARRLHAAADARRVDLARVRPGARDAHGHRHDPHRQGRAVDRHRRRIHARRSSTIRAHRRAPP